MKKLLLMLVLVAGCHHRPDPNKPATGAATPKAAVDQFMLAIRAQDLQAVTSVWGNSKGPARDRMPREESEKRGLLMVCYFSHDSYTITSDNAVTAKKHLITTEIKKGKLTRSAEFTVERGPGSRWYSSVADVTSVKDLCQPQRSSN